MYLLIGGLALAGLLTILTHKFNEWIDKGVAEDKAKLIGFLNGVAELVKERN